MRARHIVMGMSLLLLTACGGGKGKPVPKLTDRVPVVTDGTVLLDETVAAPSILVLVDPDGKLAVADAPEGPNVWELMSTKAPRGAGVPIDREALGPLVRESAALRTKIEPRVKGGKDDEFDLGALEDTKGLTDDDPPPPPPEEEEEDDGEDSGGTGTAMMLEEGKMGKKDSDRAAGSYRMRMNSDDPQLDRSACSVGVGAFLRLTGDPTAEMPSRIATVTGARPGGSDRKANALIVAAPAGKASPLLDLFEEIGGIYVAVNHQGRLRALRIGFGLCRDSPGVAVGSEQWVEVRVTGTAITVEAVPSPPATVAWAQGPLDTAALTKAYADARAAVDGGERKDVDVLVGPEVDVQRLVDVIAALDAAGAHVVVLGRLPGADAPEMAKRGKRIVRALPGMPQSVGDLDRALIRQHVRQVLPQVKACYEKALAVNPSLGGTVQTQFFISPNGTVAAASASGVDPEVASCVAGVIKAIEFPKPKGGGGVQVNYPFTFRN